MVHAIFSIQHSVSQTVNVLESQTYSDIGVDAYERSGTVCINVYRILTEQTCLTKNNNFENSIGRIKEGFRPIKPYVQFIGSQNESWLLFQASVNGEIYLYHKYGADSLYWAQFEGSLSYPIA